jgi:hypothetical protein
MIPPFIPVHLRKTLDRESIDNTGGRAGGRNGFVARLEETE